VFRTRVEWTRMDPGPGVLGLDEILLSISLPSGISGEWARHFFPK
jgi:hypothetical protein